MREEELKYRVADLRALEAVAGLLGAPARIEDQCNYYYDTPEHTLHGRGILVRLRIMNGLGRRVLTVKIAERIEAGLIVADEEERDLASTDVAALRENPAGFLAELPMALLGKALTVVDHTRLVCVGTLATRRRCYHVAAGFLALDAVAFPAGDEFEIELETADTEAGRAYIETLCARAGVSAWKEAEPKTGRLFRQHGGSVE